jgi:hypothetical protein
LENQAKRHYRAAGRNLARFAADLRRLQDGEAHVTRGFSSFGAYARAHLRRPLRRQRQEDQHPRRRPAGARTARKALAGRADRAAARRDRPARAGRRAVAAWGRHDAWGLRQGRSAAPGRAVVESTVDLAVPALLTPTPASLEAPGADREPSPPAAGDTPVDVGDQEPDDDPDDDPLEDPEAVHELHDRLIEIRRGLDDLSAVTSELAAARGRREAERILTDLLEEMQELPDALAAAIASQDAD